MALHINIEDLLSVKIVDSEHITDRAIPKRYRNRRLGDFLKELKLTEGHATGLPALKEAMKLNGSPDPVFDFDEDRSWFQVMLPIHPNFKRKQPVIFDLNRVKWDILGIDHLLNEILSKEDFHQTGGTVEGIASNQVSNQVDLSQNTDNQIIEIINLMQSNQVSTIAGGIASGIAENKIEVLKRCLNANIKEIILSSIKLSNQRKNYVEYVKPLVDINWLTMTIPSKPTSPKQQYLTTLKGRLILEFLKHKTNRTK